MKEKGLRKSQVLSMFFHNVDYKYVIKIAMDVNSELFN